MPNGWLSVTLKRRLCMELKTLSPELEEVRNVLIASNITTCYLILDEIVTRRGDTLFYEKFKKEWLSVYKEIYRHVSKMKPRKAAR
jgi:hypothetical protein